MHNIYNIYIKIYSGQYEAQKTQSLKENSGAKWSIGLINIDT